MVRDIGKRRRLFLVDGQVRITVTHGVSKPIDVYLPHIVLEDVGTQYNVSAHAGVTTVAVTAGSIRIREYSDDGTLSDPVNVTGLDLRRAPLTLSPGDSARLEERGGTMFAYVERNDPGEAELRSSWLLGAVTTPGEPLDEIVAQFNRYNSIPIEIEDRGIAHMKVGGNYLLTDPDSFLEYLNKEQGLQAVPVPAGSGDAVQMYLLRAPDRGDTGKGHAGKGGTAHRHWRP